MTDAFLSLGVIFTFILGVWNIIYNYRNSRRTSFINTVTSERVAWIERLRSNISKFCGLTHTWMMSQLHGKDSEADVLKQLDELRYYIRLQLNPKAEASLDRKIETLISEIVSLCVPEPNQDKVLGALDDLTKSSQELLKTEWDKVKDESKRGDLRDNEHCLDPLFTAMNSWCLKRTKKWGKK
jgi:hypothetical protein